MAANWDFHAYGPGQTMRLESLEIEIEVAQVYRRASVPAKVKEESVEYLI